MTSGNVAGPGLVARADAPSWPFLALSYLPRRAERPLRRQLSRPNERGAGGLALTTSTRDPLAVTWLVLAVIALTLVISHVHAKGQRALVERRQELERWEHNISDNVASHTWVVHFSTMRMAYRFVFYDGPGNDSSAEYLMRRSPAGAWERQPTYESWQNEINELTKRIEQKRVFYKESEEQLEAISGGPTWEQLSDAMAPALETAYQRYLHQRT